MHNGDNKAGLGRWHAINGWRAARWRHNIAAKAWRGKMKIAKKTKKALAAWHQSISGMAS